MKLPIFVWSEVQKFIVIVTLHNLISKILVFLLWVRKMIFINNHLFNTITYYNDEHYIIKSFTSHSFVCTYFYISTYTLLHVFFSLMSTKKTNFQWSVVWQNFIANKLVDNLFHKFENFFVMTVVADDHLLMDSKHEIWLINT